MTRPELHDWVRRLFHERTTQKLSVQALETLAVIAYKQPITAAEITEIRGVNTAGVLGTLVDRHLIKIAGRKQVVGRPFMYATTREFLDRFGLRDLAELPKIEDMADALGFEPPSGLEGVADASLPFDAAESESRPPGRSGTRIPHRLTVAPVRLQKLLSSAGVASRRAAEVLITQGRVSVNGDTVSTLGAQADPDVDDVRVDGRRVKVARGHRYLLLNKPTGVVTTGSIRRDGRP